MTNQFVKFKQTKNDVEVTGTISQQCGDTVVIRTQHNGVYAYYHLTTGYVTQYYFDGEWYPNKSCKFNAETVSLTKTQKIEVVTQTYMKQIERMTNEGRSNEDIIMVMHMMNDAVLAIAKEDE